MSEDVEKIKSKVSKIDVEKDKELQDEVEQWEIDSTKGGNINKFHKKNDNK
ncbi:MAG: hypothetical protein R3321_04475 [Nitrososphaeraceae archaeon]|nr:hypothetical protein [Nitrososphaeraceae archaeon]